MLKMLANLWLYIDLFLPLYRQLVTKLLFIKKRVTNFLHLHACKCLWATMCRISMRWDILYRSQPAPYWHNIPTHNIPTLGKQICNFVFHTSMHLMLGAPEHHRSMSMRVELLDCFGFWSVQKTCCKKNCFGHSLVGHGLEYVGLHERPKKSSKCHRLVDWHSCMENQACYWRFSRLSMYVVFSLISAIKNVNNTSTYAYTSIIPEHQLRSVMAH